MNPTTALYQLRHMPDTFLRNNALYIAGGAASGVTPLHFGTHQSQPAGAGAPNEAFLFTTAAPVVHNPVMVQVQNVRMIPSAENVDIHDLEAYQLAAAPDILVTGQLSACSFCVLTVGGQVIVAHLQPGGVRPAGPMLQRTLELTGRFHGHGVHRFTRVFGPANYSHRAHVVGVRIAGHWQIYAQHFTGNGSTYRIQNVTQIV